MEQTNQAAEGPQVFKLNDGSGYIVIYDEFLAGGFQGDRTTDFKTFTLIPNSDLAALTPRHGGVVSLTTDELQTVIANERNISVTRAVQVPSRNRMLQSSPVRGTFTSADVGTLKSDNSWASEIWGLSADGSVAVGDSHADPNGRSIRAAAWSGGGFSRKRELGTLKTDGSGASKAYAVSKTGAVIAGIAENDDRRLHAIVWSDQDWRTKTDLGTLTANPRSTSGAYALSADGGIVAGESSVDAGGTHAALWSGRDWSVKRDLGTLRSDNSGMSWAYALSGDGSVVGGYSSADYGVDVDPHATIWSGANYATKTDLGTLRSDNQGISSVRALSGDGHVAAGNSSTDFGFTHGAVWSGPSWSRETDLGTLRADNSGSSWVRALSTDGRVAGGAASSSMGPAHGAVWFGPDWVYKTDLGTVKSGGEGVSEVQALSADGTIAAGYSDVDSGEPHAALWKISYPALANPPVDGAQPPVKIVDATHPALANPPIDGAQPLVKIVDATYSASTIYQLGAETFEALEAQRRSSSRLQITCQADEQRYCWSVNGGFSTDEDGSSIPTGLTGGVGLTDSLTFGASLNYSLVRPSTASYEDNSQHFGGGIFLDLHQPSGDGGWFVRAALSYAQYDVDINRPTLRNTEEGIGASTISSFGGSVKLGQNIALASDWSAG